MSYQEWPGNTWAETRTHRDINLTIISTSRRLRLGLVSLGDELVCGVSLDQDQGSGGREVGSLSMCVTLYLPPNLTPSISLPLLVQESLAYRRDERHSPRQCCGSQVGCSGTLSASSTRLVYSTIDLAWLRAINSTGLYRLRSRTPASLRWSRFKGSIYSMCVPVYAFLTQF